jgi:hypothetical protein
MLLVESLTRILAGMMMRRLLFDSSILSKSGLDLHHLPYTTLADVESQVGFVKGIAKLHARACDIVSGRLETNTFQDADPTVSNEYEDSIFELEV